MDPRLFQRITMIEGKKINFKRQSLILHVIKCQSCHSLFIVQYGEDRGQEGQEIRSYGIRK